MTDLIKRYFAAFNAKDIEGMMACVADDVVHHPNEGDIRTGKESFREFCNNMAKRYDEELVDMIIAADKGGTNFTAQYRVKGIYVQTDGLYSPLAQGQRYSLPCKSYFQVEDGLITKVATVYDKKDWIAQVS